MLESGLEFFRKKGKQQEVGKTLEAVTHPLWSKHRIKSKQSAEVCCENDFHELITTATIAVITVERAGKAFVYSRMQMAL